MGIGQTAGRLPNRAERLFAVRTAISASCSMGQPTSFSLEKVDPIRLRLLLLCPPVTQTPTVSVAFASEQMAGRFWRRGRADEYAAAEVTTPTRRHHDRGVDHHRHLSYRL